MDVGRIHSDDYYSYGRLFVRVTHVVLMSGGYMSLDKPFTGVVQAHLLPLGIKRIRVRIERLLARSGVRDLHEKVAVLSDGAQFNSTSPLIGFNGVAAATSQPVKE